MWLLDRTLRSSRSWRTIDEVEYATVEYIDWFNNRGLHSEIDSIPPIEAETQFYDQQPTATTGPNTKVRTLHQTPAGSDRFCVLCGRDLNPPGACRVATERRRASADVELQWATYQDAADEAGESRRYGGIHIAADDLAGRKMGAEVAELVWDKAQTYFG